MLPLFGAIGGMVVPAALYASLHAGGPASSGWGVPMATDIAFAVAALALFGKRVPSGLKVFLLALAIVDDLGAISVIAVFYTHGISLAALACAGGGLALAFATAARGRALLRGLLDRRHRRLARHAPVGRARDRRRRAARPAARRRAWSTRRRAPSTRRSRS